MFMDYNKDVDHAYGEDPRHMFHEETPSPPSPPVR